MHSLRAGFFITIVINNYVRNGFRLDYALMVANVLGNWSSRTHPDRFYDKHGLIQQSVDHSVAIQGRGPIIINVLDEPKDIHMLIENPKMTDNIDFMEEQVRHNVPFVKLMLKPAVNMRFQANPDGNYVSVHNAVLHAIGWFAFKINNEVAPHNHVQQIRRFFDSKNEHVDRGLHLIQWRLWPDHTRTLDDMVLFVHRCICVPVLNGECPLQRNNAY